jgi:hypothetical protein
LTAGLLKGSLNHPGLQAHIGIEKQQPLPRCRPIGPGQLRTDGCWPILAGPALTTRARSGLHNPPVEIRTAAARAAQLS